jgi:hypothetical protein
MTEGPRPSGRTSATRGSCSSSSSKCSMLPSSQPPRLRGAQRIIAVIWMRSASVGDISWVSLPPAVLRKRRPIPESFQRPIASRRNSWRGAGCSGSGRGSRLRSAVRSSTEPL